MTSQALSITYGFTGVFSQVGGNFDTNGNFVVPQFNPTHSNWVVFSQNSASTTQINDPMAIDGSITIPFTGVYTMSMNVDLKSLGYTGGVYCFLLYKAAVAGNPMDGKYFSPVNIPGLMQYTDGTADTCLLNANDKLIPTYFFDTPCAMTFTKPLPNFAISLSGSKYSVMNSNLITLSVPSPVAST